MNIRIFDSPEEIGKYAAQQAAQEINEAIAANNQARIIVATGASQFEMLSVLIHEDIAWNKVEMFHLDEYIGISEEHPASFRKYLKERLIRHVDFAKVHLVSGEGDIAAHISSLNAEITKAPVDLALVGIGENAHIAFNDPPADFESKEAYKIVNLDSRCKAQQVREGWFANEAGVPEQAITMTVHQILQAKKIIACVPHAVKAEAVKNSAEQKVSAFVPASILQTHSGVSLYLDRDSSSLLKQ